MRIWCKRHRIKLREAAGAPSVGPDPLAHSIPSFLDESATATRLLFRTCPFEEPSGKLRRAARPHPLEA